jgi:Concanavalin A-like lectin/glucanases superfamily
MITVAPPARQLKLVSLVTACFVLASAVTIAAPASAQEIWRFDQTASLGTHATRVLGHPQVIDTEIGKAIAFNGVDDALFVGVHPLAGVATWTWEMIFKPDADGKPAQRVFHLQSVDPSTGLDIANERMLFEIRIVASTDGQPAQWCLDSFATAGGQSRALLNCEKLHPFGKWYRVTAVYDGKMLHNYVGDELQGEGALVIPAERPGRSSVGTRIDLRDYYKGAMYEARFTRRALDVGDFLKLPPGK